MKTGSLLVLALVLGLIRPYGSAAATTSPGPWKVGEPIITYWAGPSMTDATARQMAEGGWNLVWCAENELEVVHRHGLRAQLHDALLNPASLESPAEMAKLDALVSRVRTNSALYSYFITDEPNATNFPGLGKLVSYLREKDPAHLAYINLFPTYASNEQLGNTGEKIVAYKAHLQDYVSLVHPSLISYDHYQFTTKGDTADYFLNLALVRRAAQAAGVPFLNIVQACTWTPSMRVPKPDELRYLVYTTLGYGAQGISYYVYRCEGHTGGFALADGTTTTLYDAARSLNREFRAIAQQLQPLRSIGVYHLGMQPPGTEPPPPDLQWRIVPPPEQSTYNPLEPLKGAMLACFGGTDKKGKVSISHVLLVNLDYNGPTDLNLRGPARLELFDPSTGKWSKMNRDLVELRLPPGGGSLLRTRR